METKIIGNARRVRVEMPLGAKRTAWDCRPFGYGRIVTPRMDVQIDLGSGVRLDAATGALMASRRATRQLAA